MTNVYAQKPIHILLLEDDPADAELICTAISSDNDQDYDFFQTDRLYKALKALKEKQFDLIISDKNLPDSTKTATFASLRSAAPNLPIIALTGEASEQAATIAMQLGAQDYLYKNDIATTNIQRVIRYAIERNKLLEEIEKERNQFRDLIEAIKSGKIDSLIGTSTPSGRIEILDSQLVYENERQRKELETERQKAIEASHFKSQFLSSMSHEIRTPLNAIQGVTDLLSETPLNEEQKEYIQMLGKANETLLQLINDILDLSKVEAGELTLEIANFNLEHVLSSTCGLMAVRARQKDLDLSFQVEQDLKTNLIGDPTRLQQILINLIGNAIKFTEKGKIHLYVKKNTDNKKLTFSVSDTGIGIPEASLNKIFKSFTQADATTTRKYGGTGLGLSISKKFVELMDGKIWVESVVKEGTTFFFEIPFKLQPDQNIKKTTNLIDLTEKNILIVDDNKQEIEIISNILKPLGVKLHSIQKAKEAIQVLKSKNIFDLVIMDCRMPEIGGLETIETLQGSSIENKCLLMLPPAHRRVDYLKMRDLGVRYHIIKPIKREQMIKEVSSFFGAKETQIDYSKLIDHRELKILVVDDTYDNRLLIERFLKDFPYHLDFAVNGAESVDMIKSKKYDLILMDMQMPILDGYSATKKIREWEQKNQKKKTTILAITASALKEEGQKSLQAGCNFHLPKPIKKSTLILSILKYSGFNKEIK